MNRPFDLRPTVRIAGHDAAAWQGWPDVARVLTEAAGRAQVVAVECYTGVFEDEVADRLGDALGARVVRTADALRSPAEVDALVAPDLTDDSVFGRLSDLNLAEFFDPDRLGALRAEVDAASGPVLVIGVGATLVHPGDMVVYADLPRWEHQLRYRRDEAANLGADNAGERWSLQYKRGYFVDWRVLDRHKRTRMDRWDVVLDTTRPGDPRLVTGTAYRDAIRQVARQPFSPVPFFDPGPWGGQWMREVCGLDARDEAEGRERPPNYAWCFNAVPEENSLRLQFGEVVVETPSINVVFAEPDALLGADVRARFGEEFPIRFDFLDTMGGGNLSLQVHPRTAYAREHFGLGYTQDESYYLMDAAPDAVVYLGLREDIDPEAMARDLRAAQDGDAPFPAEHYAATWPVQTHDHVSIPAGTVHCSGAGSMVLEISATPYLFTFKLWDWGRLGLDGRPRPIHIERGLATIAWDRTEAWTRANLVGRTEAVAEGDGWREERTGLDTSQFIETRRHWFTAPVPRDTEGTVHVLCLVEGEAALVESPEAAFAPFEVGYAEVAIVPASVGAYTVRPAASGAGPLGLLTAYVRPRA
ncbi:MAG: class I mannose-6-phosphate isomerase [Bacteroidota bacterium]